MGEYDDLLGRGEYAPVDWRRLADERKGKIKALEEDLADAQREIDGWRHRAGWAESALGHWKARAERAEAKVARVAELAEDRKQHVRLQERRNGYSVTRSYLLVSDLTRALDTPATEGGEDRG